jgi:hypothetical protein
MPGWFAADQIFETPAGWYIGSPDGYRVGPYRRREAAAALSADISGRLGRCHTTRDRVRAVRRFLLVQSADGRHLQCGPAFAEAQTSAADAADAGEAARTALADAMPGQKPGHITGHSLGGSSRSGEAPRTWFRTDRCFSVSGAWFFGTREGIDLGPYTTRATAERAASELLTLLVEAAGDEEARQIIRTFRQRPAEARRNP